MKSLNLDQLSVLTFIDEHSPVSAHELDVHFKDINAVEIANEMISDPYLYVKCKHGSNSVSIYTSLKDNFELTEKGRKYLHNAHSEKKALTKSEIAKILIAFISGVLTKTLADFLQAILTQRK